MSLERLRNQKNVTENISNKITITCRDPAEDFVMDLVSYNLRCDVDEGTLGAILMVVAVFSRLAMREAIQNEKCSR